MKNKIIKIIKVIGLSLLGIILFCFIFYMYDMHNGKVEKVAFFDEFQSFLDSDPFVEDFETTMQKSFEEDGINRQFEPVTTPQIAKKIAQEVFYKSNYIEALTTYRPYSVYHDENAKMWVVYAYPGIYRNIPFIFGMAGIVVIRDDGYLIGAFWG